MGHRIPNKPPQSDGTKGIKVYALFLPWAEWWDSLLKWGRARPTIKIGKRWGEPHPSRLKGNGVKRLTIRERLLWVSLGIQRNILWIALGVFLAIVLVERIGFYVPNPGFDAEAVKQGAGQ